MIKNYCLGFMFSKDKSKVLLILKDRPEWQKNHLNGIGGKEEPQDHSIMSITQVREFEEETGINTVVQDWDLFAIITGKETENKTGTEIGSVYNIHCYKSFSDNIFQAKQMESELPVVVKCNYLQEMEYIGTPILPNVNWLIPMALHHSNSVLEIKYN